MNQANAYAIQLLGALPWLIKTGVDVSDLIDHGVEKLDGMRRENRLPTAAEWKELSDRIDRKRARPGLKSLSSDDPIDRPIASRSTAAPAATT